MTTFLSALRFAVNIETSLALLQVARFRSVGDVSTRLLPPLVPLYFLRELPPEGELDAVRRTHRMDLHRHELSTTSYSTAIAAAYRLEIGGFSALRRDIATRWASDTSPLVTGVGGGRSRDATEPAVYLGWTEQPKSEAPPIALPNTQALWLSVFSLEYSDTPRWWSDASWDLLYSRRCTNRHQR